MIALLGGSFDPVHSGHLTIGRTLLTQWQFSQCRLIPCGKPPHKLRLFATPAQRWHMLQLATENSSLLLDDRELRSANISYTIHTVRSIRKEVGMRMPLFWIMGTDAYPQFPHWHRAEDILRATNLLLIPRPSWNSPATAINFATRKHNPVAGTVFFLPLPIIDIASSTIRDTVRCGKNLPTDTIPPSVLEYIQQKEIYVA